MNLDGESIVFVTSGYHLSVRNEKEGMPHRAVPQETAYDSSYRWLWQEAYRPKYARSTHTGVAAVQEDITM